MWMIDPPSGAAVNVSSRGDRAGALLHRGHLLKAPLTIGSERRTGRGAHDGRQARGQQRRPAAPPARGRRDATVHDLSSVVLEQAHREPPRLNVMTLLNVRPDPPAGV